MTRPPSPLPRLPLLGLLGLLAFAPHPRAQITMADPAGDPVLARVDGNPIRMSDVQAAIADLPAELRNMPPQMLVPLLLDQMIASRALTQAARGAGLERDPVVRRQVEQAEEQALQNAYVAREVNALLTDARLRETYARIVRENPPEPEVRARHILLRTEAEARAVIGELAGGANFEELARRRSTGPGAAQGGDLGFFKRGDMVPEFAEAAFALAVGATSPEPVRSPFGWHVIRVEERRTAEPPPYEQVRDQIRQQATEEAVQAVITRVRDAARVERFNPDGSPVGPAPAQPRR
jgi:peptidyl-prolyl cis-trans isomerase C